MPPFILKFWAVITVPLDWRSSTYISISAPLFPVTRPATAYLLSSLLDLFSVGIAYCCVECLQKGMCVRGGYKMDNQPVVWKKESH